jgi:signal transduction histidine kinase
VRERIRHFGGEMQIDSTPGDGTVVVLILPLEAKRNEVGQ